MVCTRPQINDWRVPFADEKTQYVPLLSFDASEQYCYMGVKHKPSGQLRGRVTQPNDHLITQALFSKSDNEGGGQKYPKF